jgi:hypothetical protein
LLVAATVGASAGGDSGGVAKGSGTLAGGDTGGSAGTTGAAWAVVGFRAVLRDPDRSQKDDPPTSARPAAAAAGTMGKPATRRK